MSSTPRADLWFSICLIAFGIAATTEAWRMPRLENLGIDPFSAPGITPGILTVVITLLGIMLFLRSVRASHSSDPQMAPGWGRLAITLGLCLLYALGLVGQIDFLLATALFVFVFTLTFADPAHSWIRRLAMAVALSAVTSVAVTMVFERVFLIRLP